ncbi:hypothetical protein DFQ26_002339 [Actinomortierella ambigua]|nr:hypothetical protein DFQ26_002339 [Actinomortierella ambigua]
MWVLEKCPHLEELILAQVLQHRARFSAQNLSTSSYGLKKLSVLQEPLSFFIYTILASCPRIESIRFLKWNTYLRQLTRTMLQTRTQHVKSIELSHHTPDSDFFSFVLEDLSHNPVRDITIHSATYATLCTMSHVYRHKVEHLVLSVSTLYAIQGVRHILSRCQALKTLRVEVGPSRFVEARTLLAAPWACLQLESLSMPLAILHTCHDDGLLKFARAEKAEVDPEGKIPEWLQAENVFMKRLGGLTQLRHLDLGIVNRSQSAKTAGFTWRFEGGLQHLAGLERLERLRLSHVHLVQGRREVRWMRNHWWSLQRLVVHQMAHRRLFAKQWPELAIEILQ